MIQLGVIFFSFLVLFTYLGHPLVLLFLSLFFRCEQKKLKTLRPSVHLLIAAYNEEKHIKEKIENSLLLNYPRELLTIWIVSDGSTDKTDDIVKTFAGQNIHLFRVEGRVGKTAALNQAVLASTSDIIIFSDASAIYNAEAIIHLVQNFEDQKIGMVSGSLRYYEKESGAMGASTKLYWFYESLIKKAQSRFYTLTGSIGCMTAFRREAYTVLPANIIEDFTGPLMMISKGLRVVYEEEAYAYERTTKNVSQEFKMRVRVIRGGMKGFLFAYGHLSFKKHWPVLLQLLGHKILRWLVPFFLLALYILSALSLAFNTTSLWIKEYFFLQSFFYLWALLFIFIPAQWGTPKFFYIPTYFVTLNTASFIAFYKTCTEDLEATWETNTY